MERRYERVRRGLDVLRSKERTDDSDEDESSSDDDPEDSNLEVSDREEDRDPPTDFSKDPSLPPWAGVTATASASNAPTAVARFHLS